MLFVLNQMHIICFVFFPKLHVPNVCFSSKPSVGWKASYTTMICCRCLVKSKISDIHQNSWSILFASDEFFMCDVCVTCLPLQPSDQGPAVQQHWWCHLGGFWQCAGQGFGPWWLQCHRVSEGRPVHRRYGQHQGMPCFFFSSHICLVYEMSFS